MKWFGHLLVGLIALPFTVAIFLILLPLMAVCGIKRFGESICDGIEQAKRDSIREPDRAVRRSKDAG